MCKSETVSHSINVTEALSLRWPRWLHELSRPTTLRRRCHTEVSTTSTKRAVAGDKWAQQLFGLHYRQLHSVQTATCTDFAVVSIKFYWTDIYLKEAIVKTTIQSFGAFLILWGSVDLMSACVCVSTCMCECLSKCCPVMDRELSWAGSCLLSGDCRQDSTNPLDPDYG